jgi:Leucine-rich repeat (LRR) protein
MVEISGSTLSHIPSEIFTKFFPTVKYFHLHDSKELNSLERSSFKNAHQLQILWLEKNSFKNLDEFLFAEAPNLEYLTLPENQIESIQSKTFHGLKKLKTLCLVRNKLKFLPIGTFEKLESLEEIFLLWNPLKVVDNWFESNGNLKIVSFHDNQIHEVHPKLFDKNPNLDFADFRKNDCVDHEFNENFTGYNQIMSQCFENYKKTCDRCPCKNNYRTFEVILLIWQIGLFIFSAVLTVFYFRISQKFKLCLERTV